MRLPINPPRMNPRTPNYMKFLINLTSTDPKYYGPLKDKKAYTAKDSRPY